MTPEERLSQVPLRDRPRYANLSILPRLVILLKEAATTNFIKKYMSVLMMHVFFFIIIITHLNIADSSPNTQIGTRINSNYSDILMLAVGWYSGGGTGAPLQPLQG